MPFRLRLKKSRQYNVASKSVYVICVELLDSTTIECTLSSESSGRDCLDNVCQRLTLQQPEFFGLRYVSLHEPPRLRWVEMDRPLKRQLDKYAREPNLLLRVMYYISGVNLIHDEMTRYHYFLQLKADVIEGRMSCDVKQAILLASYSMQAEFGNHDLERHTAEYLKDFALFPKHLTEQGHLQHLTEAVICQHAALAGLPQGTAEEYYILAAQQLDGYGQETFSAKDESNAEVIIGVSLNGILVGYEKAHSSKFYRWKDIKNVINHKRYFGIECPNEGETVQFQFTDPESAKYVWRMCVHQHTFYMQHEGATEPCQNFNDSMPVTLFQTGIEDSHLSESQEDLDCHDGGINWRIQSAVQRAQSASCLDLTKHTEVEKLRALLPSYRPAPDYETAVQLKYRGSSQAANNVNMRPNSQINLLYSSQPEIHQSHMQDNISSYHYKQYPDVTQVERIYLDPRREEPQTHLKGRPERSSQTVLHTYSTPELDAVESQMVQNLQMLHLYKPPPPYPTSSTRPSSNSTPDLASQGFRPQQPQFAVPQVSGSSPDLVSPHAQPSAQNVVLGAETHHTYMDVANVLDSGMRCCAGAQEQSEPIYENIPLPWASQSGCSRSRASSIQSAPEMGSPVTAMEGQRRWPNAIMTVPSATPAANVSVSVHSAYDVSNTSLQETYVPNAPDTVCQSPGEPTNPGIADATYIKSQSQFLESDRQTEYTKMGTTKQKPKRKWALLGGGKSKSKPEAAVKETNEEETRVRWNTGLPRLPLPPTISKDIMCQLLERKLADGQVFFEFEKIPKKKLTADFTTALHPDNASRNRYMDALPYEENRVRLTPSRQNKFGYINASHITATVGSHQRFYIAAQGPLPSTVSSFWQMVWEADVHLIVQLTVTQEDGTAPYCPGINDHCLEIDEFQIWQQFSQETGHCVTTKLRLIHTSSRRVRGVWHLQYVEWGDQGCPLNVGHFLGFLEEVSSVRQHTVSEIPAGHNCNPPVLVHCTAGVGRTGIMILSDLLLYTLDHSQELDIPRVVALLRNQRMLLVQTVAQYKTWKIVLWPDGLKKRKLCAMFVLHILTPE
ncbi:tyrosine-protein phosphatase non-receptor type 14 [Schistocerca serialis cubense]|uniref:tyrosine-protein phosphatase non-receptor type 14 n=1 Tax=Schistocerca serialis cubense TaxID=2023355 RepID=UPI00214E9A5B|nr:tyrosine-protein phosphatase non-receptor type 14 [Schistocerca serialis cubense]